MRRSAATSTPCSDADGDCARLHRSSREQGKKALLSTLSGRWTGRVGGAAGASWWATRHREEHRRSEESMKRVNPSAKPPGTVTPRQACQGRPTPRRRTRHRADDQQKTPSARLPAKAEQRFKHTGACVLCIDNGTARPEHHPTASQQSCGAPRQEQRRAGQAGAPPLKRDRGRKRAHEEGGKKGSKGGKGACRAGTL